MKRVGFLFDDIVDRDNLLVAFLKASRGKHSCDEWRRYSANLDENLIELGEGLRNFTFQIGNYKHFTIYDPKVREICAAPFPERVLHHAIMNVCGPHFERWLIDDSFASRKGRGQMRAVRRAQYFAQHNRWFLKCDIRKYFDSISHAILIEMLRRKFKDPFVLMWFEKLIATYETTHGRGLPIGNLTSQYFANLYLDGIDRLHAPYVRYMDDFIFWSNDKNVLLELRKRVASFAYEELDLSLKEESYINRSPVGMDFLGFRVFPNRVNLSRKSARRYLSKIKAIARTSHGEYEDQCRLSSLTAFVLQADSYDWRRDHLTMDSA